MFRFLLSAASIFVLLTATVFFPAAVSARRCGVQLPTTLLSLYRNSQFIYIGKYDKSEEGDMTEETDDYRVIPIKKHFSISSALKGESQKLLVLEESEYRYKIKESVEEETDTADGEEGDKAESAELIDEEEGDEADRTKLQPGDSVLLFLNKDEDSEQFNLSHYNDGIKKMTPEGLSSYEARIRELSEIFATAKPKYDEIVAWLVRCAEDPQTRWEGTFELLQSFQNVEWQEERAKESAEKPGQESGVTGEYTPDLTKEFDTGDPNFAKALTEGQKLILTNILLNRAPKRSDNTEEQTSQTWGDRELIELVKRWGDSRIAESLVEQLRYDPSDTSLNAELMQSIAVMLNDSELAGISDSYSGIQWESEEDAIDADTETPAVNAESPTEAAEQTAETLSVEQTIDVAVSAVVDQPSEVTAAENSTAPAPENEKQEAKKKTYGELRAELLKKFLDQADRVIARQQDGKNEN